MKLCFFKKLPYFIDELCVFLFCQVLLHDVSFSIAPSPAVIARNEVTKQSQYKDCRVGLRPPRNDDGEILGFVYARGWDSSAYWIILSISFSYEKPAFLADNAKSSSLARYGLGFASITYTSPSLFTRRSRRA